MLLRSVSYAACSHALHDRKLAELAPEPDIACSTFNVSLLLVKVHCEKHAFTPTNRHLKPHFVRGQKSVKPHLYSMLNISTHSLHKLELAVHCVTTQNHRACIEQKVKPVSNSNKSAY